MAFALFGARGFEFCDGATTGRSKEQKRATIRRSHLPQLRPKALIIRIGLTATLPRKLIEFSGGVWRVGESMNLQIELHGVFEALAGGPVAAAGSGAAAEVSGGEGEREEEEERDYV